MQQFGFTMDRMKEILRAEYNRRYKREGTIMDKNGKITPFGQRVNRMMEIQKM